VSDPRHERLEELMSEAAVWGLDEGGAAELEREALALGIPLDAGQFAFDCAAGAATAALLPLSRERVPESLMQRLQADAVAFFARRGVVRLQDLARFQGGMRLPSPAVPPAARSPWLLYVASAAALLLAFAVLFGRTGEPTRNPVRARAALMDSGQVDVRHPWKAATHPAAANIGGDVVWSTARQEGYMRLHGLAPNDANRQQYQLWIVDGTRDGAPVDGGVFDVPAGADEVVVPVDAKLPVRDAVAFVITVERPGGVVVSAQGEAVAAVAGL